MKKLQFSTTGTKNFRFAPLAALATLAMCICPTAGMAATPTTVYAGSSGGLFKSTDGGQNWTNVFAQPPNGLVTAIGTDPTNTQVIYIGVGGAIYKTTDGGAHWNNMSTGLPPGPAADVSTIVVDPSNSSTVYAGSGDEFQGGFYKSTNGGAHWTNLSSGVPLVPPPYQGSAPILDLFALAIDPIHPQTLYLTGQTGTLTSKSTNGGNSWTALNFNGGAGSSIAINPVNDSNVYFSGPFGLSETTDGGNTWTSYLTPPQTGVILVVNGLAIDPSNPSTVYAGAGNTIYKTPGFASFATLGTATTQIRGLIVDPANSMTIYASALEGVYVSTQGGATGTWQLTLSSKFSGPLAMEPNPAQGAFFNFTESAAQQLITEAQTSAHPAFTCDLLKVLVNELPIFVQWDLLSSGQGQALTGQIQAVLQSSTCQ